MTTPDIEWLYLACSYLLLLLPVALFWHYRTNLVRGVFIGATRMTIQLLFIGVYLEFLFEQDNPFLNLAWALIMTFITARTVIQRSELRQKYFLGPVFAGLSCALLTTGLVYIGFVLRPENPLHGPYLIPILGMILGNSLSSCIIALRSFYSSLLKDENLYRYHLACGADQNEALFGFMQEALRNAFQPSLGTMATVGLVSIPGMMTGQILGGNSPMTAIKYQIMVMLAILTTSCITVFVSIALSKRLVFTDLGMLNRKIKLPVS